MIGKKFEDISRVESAKEDELSILTLELTVGISLTLVKAESLGIFTKPEPQPVQILGEAVHCLICRNDLFYSREAQLNTAAASFFNLD